MRMRCYIVRMRRVGELNSEAEAQTFHDALVSRGIENTPEAEDGGAVSIWVHDDDQITEAARLLALFRASPDAPEFSKASAKAAVLRAEKERAERSRRSTVVDEARVGYERDFSAFAWLPAVLMLLCVAVTIWAGEFGFMPSAAMRPNSAARAEQEADAARVFERRNRIAMTQWRTPTDAAEIAAIFSELQRNDGTFTRALTRHYYDASLPEVRHGEVWRLFATVFLHFGLMHLVFNLMWLRELGTFIQNRFGALHLGVLVLVSAVASNYAQLLWSGPGSGGFSGVNYALFGYLWIRGKFDRFCGWQLNQQIVQTMLLWFFLCFTPLIPNIANAAHAAGLIVGMAAGFLLAKIAARRRGS